MEKKQRNNTLFRRFLEKISKIIENSNQVETLTDDFKDFIANNGDELSYILNMHYLESSDTNDSIQYSLLNTKYIICFECIPDLDSKKEESDDLGSIWTTRILKGGMELEYSIDEKNLLIQELLEEYIKVNTSPTKTQRDQKLQTPVGSEQYNKITYSEKLIIDSPIFYFLDFNTDQDYLIVKFNLSINGEKLESIPQNLDIFLTDFRNFNGWYRHSDYKRLHTFTDSEYLKGMQFNFYDFPTIQLKSPYNAIVLIFQIKDSSLVVNLEIITSWNRKIFN
jgi:hypothetical protein